MTLPETASGPPARLERPGSGRSPAVPPYAAMVARVRGIGVEQVGAGIALIACVWFALVAGWGLFGILPGGHVGAGHAGTAMMAEQLLRWKILYPAYGWYEPTFSPSNAYCHHPFGAYYLSALSLAIFGHRDFAVPLPAVLMSAGTAPLLYQLCRKNWGIAGGVAAVCSFVTVPIAVGFANFHNLEVMCIFGWVLFFYGHTRLLESWRTKDLILSLVGAAIAVSADWEGYLGVGVVLGWSLLRLYVLPSRFTPAVNIRIYSRWWALTTALCVVTLAFWVGMFVHLGKLNDWLGAAEVRGGDSTPLEAALEGRKHWIDVCFTPLAIALGKISAPLCFLRLAVRRRDAEVYSIAVLVTAVVHYVAFKRAADVHIFWPHYFAFYYALAMAQLTATIRDALVRLARARRSRATAAWPEAFALGVPVLVALVMFPDTVRTLRFSRETGGRYGDINGALFRSAVDMLFVIKRKLAPIMTPGHWVDAHSSAGWGWEQMWALGAVSRIVGGLPAAQPATTEHPFWIGRSSGLSPEEQKQLATSAHAVAYGDTWLVDQREPPAPIDAFSLHEREPNLLEWYFISGVEPMRSIGPERDPFLTWEWRIHLGQPADIVLPRPTTLNEKRIVHNAAIERHDAALAASLRSEIVAALDTSRRAEFDQGILMIGARVTSGAKPRVEAWFEASGNSTSDGVFDIHSLVIEKKPFSLIPIDDTVRAMSYPPPISPKLWRPGYIYFIDAPLNHRIGKERYWGSWISRSGAPPRRLDGAPLTELAVVP